MWCLRRISSSGGCGSNQSLGVFVSPMSGFSVVVAERRASREALVVRGCDPVSALRRTRPGALWRAAPPLAVFRMAACMS